MNRLKIEFNKLKAENRGGFIPFIVAGDPNLETTKDLILELAKQGASVIELGVPFSDPVADGVTIQASGERALRNRIGVKDILQIVADVRESGCEIPIILFGYFNPILQFGLEKFVEILRLLRELNRLSKLRQCSILPLLRQIFPNRTAKSD